MKKTFSACITLCSVEKIFLRLYNTVCGGEGFSLPEMVRTPYFFGKYGMRLGLVGQKIGSRDDS